jgi:hypothetical protein
MVGVRGVIRVMVGIVVGFGLALDLDKVRVSVFGEGWVTVWIMTVQIITVRISPWTCLYCVLVCDYKIARLHRPTGVCQP